MWIFSVLWRQWEMVSSLSDDLLLELRYMEWGWWKKKLVISSCVSHEIRCKDSSRIPGQMWQHSQDLFLWAWSHFPDQIWPTDHSLLGQSRVLQVDLSQRQGIRTILSSWENTSSWRAVRLRVIQSSSHRLLQARYLSRAHSQSFLEMLIHSLSGLVQIMSTSQME